MKRPCVALALLGLLVCLVVGLRSTQEAIAGGGPTKGTGLFVKSIANPPASALMGGPLAVRYEVGNRARGSAAGWISFFLSPDQKLAPGDLYVGSQKVKKLGPGRVAAGRASLRMPSVEAAKSFHLLGCLAAQKQVRAVKGAAVCEAAKGSLLLTRPPGPGPNPGPGTGGGAGERVPPTGAAPTRTLKVELAGAGAGAGTVTGPGIDCPGDCTQGYADGEAVSLLAAAGGGGSFTGWGGDCSGSGQCHLAMSADRAVTASFTPADSLPPPQTGSASAPAPGPVESPPPAPASVAPELAEAQATSIGDATSFLYEGSDPIQDDVDPGAIDAVRTAAVLRGIVTDEANAPLAGVRVTVLDHPELGQTATRADGRYDIAVNGGGSVTLVFEREGFIGSQRLVENVPWLDYARVDDVALVAYETKSNVIDLDSPASNQVAESSVSQDGDGNRRSTLIFEHGTDAAMTMPDGSTKSLDELTVRSTEYTVGANGLDAMPGQLPPSTAFTYAVELSIDQAVAAGATDVRFDKPVVNYVDNFLDFPAGTDVPTGYYDREKGEWLAGPDGRVIEIVSEASGVAAVDSDGDGQADGAAELAGLGIDEAELRRLATLYDPGKSLWRVQVTHFTPWDYNFPYGPPPGAEGPGNPPAEGDGPPRDPCKVGGSIVDCEGQVLGESLEVIGTGLTLNYRSNRVPGRTSAYTLEIPVSRATVPADLAGIELQVEVAGRTFNEELPPTPNQVHKFVWDGTDAYGRPVQGAVPATVRIGYRYEAVYQQPEDFEKSWSRFSGVPVSGDRARKTISFDQEYTTTLGAWDARGMGLGGWTLSAQNAYDPGGRTLYLGDGGQRSAEANPVNTLKRYVGVGLGFEGGGDGGPALEATLDEPQGLAVGADGSLYVADTEDDRIRRVAADGTITTVAGDGAYGFAGDGGAATAAELASPEDVAVGADGSLYIADTKNNRIRRVRPDGTIVTVAGGGHPADSLGDDGPATAARLAEPSGVAIAPDGTLYVADQFHNRLRMVSPDGSITTVAGDGSIGAGGDGGPALQAQLKLPHDVVVGADGSVYVADTGNGTVRKIRLDGIIERFAGGGEPATGIGDEGPAPAALLSAPTALALAADGSLLIAERGNDRVRSVVAGGTIVTLAGGGVQTQDEAPAADSLLHDPAGIATLPNGKAFIAEEGASKVGAISAIFNGFGPGDVFIPSADGSQVYQFNRNGRQLRTLDALTGGVLYSFAYDSAGLLTAITERGVRTTTIERDADGAPTAIVAPGGQRTTLDLNADGYLSEVENPAGEGVGLTYAGGGLLSSTRDPLGAESKFTYGPGGRLSKDEDADGVVRNFARQEIANGYRVTMTTGLGATVKYQVERLADGGMRRTTTDRAGGATVATLGADGGVTVASPDGSRTAIEMGPDPRFGLQAPIERSRVETMPSGLQRVTTQSRSATLAEEANPLTLLSLTDLSAVNGHSSVLTYDGPTRTLKRVSPEGRTSTTVLDGVGRVVSLKAATGVAPIATTYDAKGRIATVAQGPQSWTYGYDSRERIATRTNAVGETLSYEYDEADLMTRLTLPSGRSYRFEHDQNGRRTALIAPGNGVNAFTFTAGGQPHVYKPPGAGGEYVRSYNGEQQQTAMSLPGGQQVTQSYDAGRRLAQIGFPQGAVGVEYAGATERAALLTRSPAGGSASESVASSYDGPMVDGVEFSGEASGSFGYEHDANFLLSGSHVEVGGKSFDLAVGHDDDGLATSFGPFAIARGGPGGAASSYKAGKLRTDLSYDSLGRVSGREQIANAQQTYSSSLSFAANGRIAAKAESVGGETHGYEYGYDLDGQLTSVKRDGTEVEHYSYDADGNRTGRQVEGGPLQVASYDAQGRVTAVAGVAYTVGLDGFLVKRGGDEFGYSARGELVSAKVGGTAVSYGYDGFGRRVSRTVAGQRTEYLYGNPSEPFQVTAVRRPGGVVDQLFYDERGLLIALEREGQRYGVATDQVGTPRVVADETGTIVKKLSFDAFGAPLADSNPAFSLPIGFAGGLGDDVTGLVHFGLRDYEPATGRFTGRDPLFFEGSPYNLYAYAGNNPLGVRDPTGLFCVGFSAFGGFGGGVSLCASSKGLSACAKAGVGIGGGFSVEPLGDPEPTGVKVYGEATASYGPASVGVSVSKGVIGCPDLNWTIGGGAGPVSVNYGSGGWGGGASHQFGDPPSWLPQGKDPVDLKWGLKGEASAGVEGCVGGKPW